MSNPIITTTFANPDPNAAPLNIVELVNLLRQLVSSAMEGSYVPYVIGPTTPGVEDQDKAWMKLDGAGRPLAMMTFYNGKWRRVYNGMPKEIRMFSGDPTNTTDGFDKDGWGIVEGQYDGWHLCNGKDGVIDLSDHFIIGATMSDMAKGWSGSQWRTNVETTLKDKGGAYQTTLTLPQVPTVGHKEIRARLWQADGNTPNTAGSLFGVGGVNETNSALLPAGQAVEAVTAPTPVNVMNPYIALGFIMFMGYK